MRADVSNGLEALLGGVATAQSLVSAIWDVLDLPVSSLDRLHIEGSEALPSAFPVTELAAATIGAASLAVSEVVGLFSAAPSVTVDRRLASLWFGWSIRPLGWEAPPAWDAIAGDYRAADGWIRLHTNAPRHRASSAARKSVVLSAVWQRPGLRTHWSRRSSVPAAARRRCEPCRNGRTTRRGAQSPRSR